LEPNNNHKYKKVRKTLFAYTIVFQMFFTVIGLAFIGYFIGDHYYPETNINLVLTGVGTLLGMIASIMMFLQFIKREELYEKHRHH